MISPRLHRLAAGMLRQHFGIEFVECAAGWLVIEHGRVTGSASSFEDALTAVLASQPLNLSGGEASSRAPLNLSGCETSSRPADQAPRPARPAPARILRASEVVR